MKKAIPKMDYLSHGIHPYTAKLIPHIPRYFMEKYALKDDVILDPFCGSGTTLLEARFLGNSAVGIDINPLATLISEVKTTPLSIREQKSVSHLAKEEVRNSSERITIEFPNIDYWFCRKAQNELSKIKSGIENLEGKIDENTYKFLLVCFSSIIRNSSYADPRIAKTYRSKRVVEKIENGWIPTPIQYFEVTLDKNLKRIKSLSERLNTKNNFVKVFQGDARETSTILNQNGIDEVDFIITSPPYINAQDYFRSYKLEIWWLGLATPEEVRQLSKETIGNECISGINYNSIPKSKNNLLDKILHKIWKDSEKIRKKEKMDEKKARNKEKANKKKAYIICNYFENMKSVFKEFYNVLKTGGHFCLISGSNTICGFQIPTYKILVHIAENNGFKLVEIGRDEIRNRALPPNRNHRGGIIKEEWITVFQKV